MLNVTEEDFEQLVSDGIDSLPDDLLEQLDNVIFLIEDWAPDGSSTLGIYEGFSLVDRSTYGYGEEPDRIILFREALLDHCDSLDELKSEIRITLVHEIAHYFGITEERIHELGWG